MESLVRRIIWPALIGVLSAAFGVALAELLAAATRPASAPLIAVGGAIIDATPTPVKEFAVRELGTNDKPVLLASIGLVLALFTALVGIFSVRRRWVTIAGALVFAVAGAGAALSRPTASLYDAVPSVLGAVVAGATILLLLRRAYPVPMALASAPAVPAAVTVPAGPILWPIPTDPIDSPAGPRPFDRRAFLQTAALVAGGAVLAGGAAEVVQRARGGALARSREAIRLPAPAQPAAPLPAGVGPGFTTPNGTFYRVDTALTVPNIDVGNWSLKIHGMVGREAELSFEDLLRRPLIERDITLNCVSNEVGGPYIGTARWLGVPLAPLLKELGVDSRADQVVGRSIEGMTIGTPVQTVFDGRDAMLCVGMNGEPLPPVHGFPVRMLTPGLYGYAGACKWLSEIELTTFAAYDPYWVKRGWSARGPVKTASRIDKPLPFAQLKPGATVVSGVAWAQRRGIKTVEVQVDDGPWAMADLLPVPSIDTWVQWRYQWSADAGPHTLTVRATDRTGAVQIEKRATPFPNGATGWHNRVVTVG
jgi:DMSO/TMAO reductase YedYZ molybdopterin-dependent catalytic subunit